MIETIFQWIDSLLLYEIDEKELLSFRRKPKILPYYRFKNEVEFKFSTEDVVINKFAIIKELLDAYGSVFYDIDGKDVYLLNTYGDEDDRHDRIPMRSPHVVVFTPCLIYDGLVEVGDIVANKNSLPRKKLKVINRMIGKIPQELKNTSFSGKRAFYYNLKERFVSLRVHSDIYKDLPEGIKHKAAEQWISAPRVKIQVEPI